LVEIEESTSQRPHHTVKPELVPRHSPQDYPHLCERSSEYELV